MKDYNKENLLFMGKIFLIALVVFFTIVMLTYAKDGLWSAPLPVLAVVYGVYSFIEKYLRNCKKGLIFSTCGTKYYLKNSGRNPVRFLCFQGESWL